MSDLTSWPQVTQPLRLVRSQETYSVCRQLDHKASQESVEWIWVTTLSAAQAPTGLVVRLGHARWDIENYGFNELANAWHADHVYKHQANAIEAFTLMAFLAYNLFHAFLARNVKPPLRRGKTESFWACLMAAEIYGEAASFIRARSP